MVYNNTNPFDYISSRACIETGKDVYVIGKATNLNKLAYKINEDDFNKILERFQLEEKVQSDNSLVRDIVRDDFTVKNTKHKRYLVVPSCNRRTCMVRIEADGDKAGEEA